MRRVALAILVAMGALFLAAAKLRGVHPVFGYLQAFAEAGLAGGLADWFAVTALFRRPLGLPIPHTAIIPKNRVRIGRALGDFIAGQLLSPELVETGLARFSPARTLADMLEADNQPGANITDNLARRMADAAPGLLQAAPKEAVEQGLRALMVEALSSAEAGPVAGEALRMFWTPDRSRTVSEGTFGFVASALAERKDDLRDELASRGGGWTLPFIDKMLADRVINAVETLLGDLQDPEHPWRHAIDQAVGDLAERLAQDPELVARVDAWKEELLLSPALDAAAHAAVERLTRPTDPADRKDGAAGLANVIAPALAALASRLRSDPAMSEPLDRAVRHALLSRILAERHTVADLVTERVAAWDEATLVRAVELQTGQDLQYIRINGALVGGVVGLAIHAISGALRLR